MTTLYTHQSQNVTKTWLFRVLFSVIVVLFTCVVQVKAEEKSYSYQKIDFTFNVNEDSTVDVIEKETFDFHGNFHNAFRYLSLNKVDDITNIEVIDTVTNLPMSFTISRKDGRKEIEWHYDLTDTTHSWILKYKLHGAISFLKDHDELYWNLFTDFTVPVRQVNVNLFLPVESDIAKLQGTLYTSTTHADTDLRSVIVDGRTFDFGVEKVLTGEMVTIAFGWPKGIINQNAYFKDVAKTWWPFILSIILLIGSIIFSFIYWYRTEKWRKGRGTIVPQYEPPQGLRPAMAEVLVKEGISEITWPATLIDLAVRGYVTIEEDKPMFFGWFGKDYIVKNKNESEHDLEDFEKSYLGALFPSKDAFSTKELKKSESKGLALYEKMQGIERILYMEIDKDTKAYEKKIYNEKKVSQNLKKAGAFVFIVGYLSITFFRTLLPGFLSENMFVALFVTILLTIFVIIWFLKYEARLSREGAIMREDWLGFKLYLETAERYRMQNLTPELFEKYLPYAMIFGIENKWAKAFDSLNMNPPTWYGTYGGYHSGSTFGSGSNSFSAAAFSSSLSSSFSSAMSASGGSGASGGGGGAGGGGGGGGGGAS